MSRPSDQRLYHRGTDSRKRELRLFRVVLAYEIQPDSTAPDLLKVLRIGAANHLAKRRHELLREGTHGRKIEQDEAIGMIVAQSGAYEIIAKVGIGLHFSPFKHLPHEQLQKGPSQRVASVLRESIQRRFTYPMASRIGGRDNLSA